MKTFILSLFIAVSISASIAQPYQSYFGDTFTRWYIFYEYGDFLNTEVFENLNNETTVINEKEYQKVSWGGNDSFCCLREEKETGKLFLYRESANDGKEFVISDMSLEKGDTVRFVEEISNIGMLHSNLYADETGYFTVVDSVYYKDNKKHIQLEAVMDEEYYPWHLAFIEGIGPNFGFFYILSLGLSFSLTCFETETTFWKNTDFWETETGWYWYYTTPNLASDCMISGGGGIHPNKTIGFSIEKQNGSITVHFEKPATGDVRMVDAQGKIIYFLSVSNAEKVSIPTTTISHGIYLLNVVDKNANRTGNEKIRL